MSQVLRHLRPEPKKQGEPWGSLGRGSSRVTVWTRVKVTVSPFEIPGEEDRPSPLRFHTRHSDSSPGCALCRQRWPVSLPSNVTLSHGYFSVSNNLIWSLVSSNNRLVDQSMGAPLPCSLLFSLPPVLTAHHQPRPTGRQPSTGHGQRTGPQWKTSHSRQACQDSNLPAGGLPSPPPQVGGEGLQLGAQGGLVQGWGAKQPEKQGVLWEQRASGQLRHAHRSLADKTPCLERGP